jgi:hypothetical protein
VFSQFESGYCVGARPGGLSHARRGFSCVEPELHERQSGDKAISQQLSVGPVARSANYAILPVLQALQILDQHKCHQSQNEKGLVHQLVSELGKFEFPSTDVTNNYRRRTSPNTECDSIDLTCLGIRRLRSELRIPKVNTKRKTETEYAASDQNSLQTLSCFDCHKLLPCFAAIDDCCSVLCLR